MELEYFVGNQRITAILEGNTILGDNVVLLEKDNNLIAATEWNTKGYTIKDFLKPSQYIHVQKGITEKLRQLIVRAGGNVNDGFSLSSYHKYVTNQQHYAITRWIQFGWNIEEFPIDFKLVEERISSIVKRSVTAEASHLDIKCFDTGLSEKKYDRMYNFHIRIVRPSTVTDYNPPHRDVWIDRLRNAVNIYAPLCGSTNLSSLPLIPGSHFFPESDIERTTEGASINGIKYSVPCIIKIKAKPPVLERPNPSENKVLIFSPYLVHGGAVNLEPDLTRVSLEIRFWEKN